jgi:PBP1b-binding outer membrane lipoprotein LpoB
MKLVFRNLLAIILITFLFVSCSKNDPTPIVEPTSNCLSGSLKYTETNFDTSTSDVINVTFDVKNTSDKDYNVSTVGAGNIITYKIKVKTTDGNLYEKKGAFIPSIVAGANKNVSISASYGTGKTYESYTFELYCE